MPTNTESTQSAAEGVRPDADLIAFDARAVRATIDLVAGATATDMSRPTPCIGWTLYGLLAHMATQHFGFAAASRGEGDLGEWKLRSLGDDPVGAYRASAEQVLDAFAADGVLDRMFPLPEFSTEQPFPARQAISFHFIDYVVHAWDVAKTLDATVELEPEVRGGRVRRRQDRAHRRPAARARRRLRTGGDLVRGIPAGRDRRPPRALTCLAPVTVIPRC